MHTKTFKFIFRTSAAVFLMFVVANLIFAFRVKQAYSDVWQQLGISKNKGEQQIKESFLTGYLHIYGVKNFKNILLNDRAAIAGELMNIAKEQMSSEAFRMEYEKKRMKAKPREHPYEVKSKEEIRKKAITDAEKSIADAEALVKKMPEMEKDMRKTIEYMRQQLVDYKDPNSRMIEGMYQNELRTKEQREKTYQEYMDRWHNDYPEDHKLIVRKRLQHFIEVAKTVDFKAELKEVNGKKKFVNPTYEAKSSEWKQIFRAGKEVIVPAMAFSEQWLRELK